MWQKQKLCFLKQETRELSYINLKHCRKKLYSSNYVKYLGVHIDANLSCKTHTKEISSKLIKADAWLSKIRHFVNKEILCSIYFVIFQSDITYVCVAWA